MKIEKLSHRENIFQSKYENRWETLEMKIYFHIIEENFGH